MSTLPHIKPVHRNNSLPRLGMLNLVVYIRISSSLFIITNIFILFKSPINQNLKIKIGSNQSFK